MSIAYVFPGQGSHEVGMGKAFYEAHNIARQTYEAADKQLGYSLSTLCFEGPIESLTDTVHQQPALFVTSMAILRVMQEAEYPAASFVAGHSLGELSALVAAGSLSFEDGLNLVRRRGELMKAAGEVQPGSMAAILGLESEVVDEICTTASQGPDDLVQLANDNCPGQIVISGHQTAVERASKLLREAGARKVVTLPITIAAHSPLMGSAAEAFAQAVDQTAFTDPQITIIANTTATPLTTPAEIRLELQNQLTGPVRWRESMQFIDDQGVDTIVEVGSGDVLQKLMKRINRKIARKSFEV